MFFGSNIDMEIFQSISDKNNYTEYFKKNLERRIYLGIIKESILSELLKSEKYSVHNIGLFYSFGYSLSILNRNSRYDSFIVKGFKTDKSLLFESLLFSDFTDKATDFPYLKIFLRDFGYISNHTMNRRICQYIKSIEDEYGFFEDIKDLWNYCPISQLRKLSYKALKMIWGFDY